MYGREKSRDLQQRQKAKTNKERENGPKERGPDKKKETTT